MDKLEKLLNEHKGKLGYPDLTVSIYDGGFTIRRNIHHSLPGSIISLSEILFNTPFLSWLEWTNDKEYRDWRQTDDGFQERQFFGYEPDYHKINLVLLSTDEERIKYVEQFVL